MEPGTNLDPSSEKTVHVGTWAHNLPMKMLMNVETFIQMHECVR